MNPKGVEGVGQTAREADDWRLEQWRDLAAYWKAETLTLRAEIQQAKQVLLQIRELSANCSSEVERARRMYQIWKLSEVPGEI